MMFFARKILFTTIVFISMFVIILYSFNLFRKNDKQIDYTLKSYKNTVALYDGEKAIKIYSNIVLNTLPPNDIQSFNNGIKVSTPLQAEKLLEDFE